ncbi:LysR family transcriptional regulator [Azohydromonas caseinilytica]|uniref:LysR family transcriptional regulator n=1 Tax=Azohydromonas caseinilytica TaxID=2728836 RepID=A0A848F4T6_9BURK|nr:LysR family transcriptional regulator [Azohydromonas caseinilytica]NML13383.1 LysR family transcriptional regulator [Azohydromonas caseinilytica]
MTAAKQYKLGAGDLELVLALVRAGSLNGVAERLGVDASTAFRALQRLERGLGQPLFERSRSGCTPLELARTLAEQAEVLESALEAARSALQQRPEAVAGTVRITTTDTLLHGLLAPALRELHQRHPLLGYELQAGNELASLTRRDADIALRATRTPPPHLVGRQLGPIRVALYRGVSAPAWRWPDVEEGRAPWVAPDDALPEHPTVLWRRRRFPKVVPVYRVNSILTVMELVALGLGVGLLPLFLARGRTDLQAMSAEVADCRTELWLLAHPESRHLRRVSAVYAHLAEALALE